MKEEKITYIKESIRKVVLCRWANLLIIAIFIASTILNILNNDTLSGETSSLKNIVLILNIITCTWVFAYFRASKKIINTDWFYAVLPLIYAVFDSIKDSLINSENPKIFNIIAHGAAGYLSGLILICLTVICFITCSGGDKDTLNKFFAKSFSREGLKIINFSFFESLSIILVLTISIIFSIIIMT
jgi:hypothetical protein